MYYIVGGSEKKRKAPYIHTVRKGKVASMAPLVLKFHRMGNVRRRRSFEVPQDLRHHADIECMYVRSKLQIDFRVAYVLTRTHSTHCVMPYDEMLMIRSMKITVREKVRSADTREAPLLCLQFLKILFFGNYEVCGFADRL